MSMYYFTLIEMILIATPFNNNNKIIKTKMASLSFTCMPQPPPEFSINNYNAKWRRSRRKRNTVSFSVSSQESVSTEKPEIELEFIAPKAGSDGSCPVEKTRAISGEKLLRDIMSDNKIELYAAYGKVMNCGGKGSCGTCIVEIVDGKELLNERTNTELRYLKKKPESWRLACQTIVGNKENSGKVVVQRMPQWKK